MRLQVNSKCKWGKTCLFAVCFSKYRLVKRSHRASWRAKVETTRSSPRFLTTKKKINQSPTTKKGLLHTPSCLNITHPTDTEIKSATDQRIDPELKNDNRRGLLTYHVGREVQRTAERDSTQELRKRSSTQFYTHRERITRSCRAPPVHAQTHKSLFLI